MRRRLLLSLLALIVSTTMAWADDNGTCGEGVTWTLTGTTLTISGTGAMEDYGSCGPWGNSITSVVIGEGVTSIGNRAFYGCTSLASVTIPNSVTSIGDNAFRYCNSLASVTFADNSELESIGNNAFEHCEKLTSITIGSGVTSIGKNAFNGCTSLSSVTFADNSMLESIGGSAFNKCTSLASVTIPSSVKSIGNNTFRSCTNLASVTFADNSKLESIGNNAFEHCEKLTSITIPDSVKSIGDYAFCFCSGLTSITVESGNSKYDSRNSCNAIIEKSTNKLIAGCKNTTIPNSVTSIGENAFYGCTSLASITIPSSVESIATDAFYFCSGLTSITVEEGNSKYDSRNSCNALIETENNTLIVGSKNTTIPDDVTSIGDYAFVFNKNLASIDIPNSVKSVGNHAFEHCEKLTSVTIGSGVTSIGYQTFCGCSSLDNVTFADNSQLTSIGEQAFYECTSLASVTIPNSVESIGNNTFNGCTSLASVNIPSSVTSIGDNAFRCNSLASVYVWATTPPTLGSNVFANNADGREIYVPAGSIDEYASGWSDYLTSLKASWAGNNIESEDFAGYWSTYYNSGCNVLVDYNTDIYYISSVSDGKATLAKNTTDKVITAGQAVMLKSSNASVTMTYSSDASGCPYTGNLLEGFDAQTTISTSAYADKVIYTLANESNGFGLYKYYDNVSSEKYTTNTTLGANKAFLPLDAAVGASSFLFDMDEVTDVREKVTVNSEKLATAQWYTLDGRKLPGKPTQKGIYIMNGKKVIII